MIAADRVEAAAKAAVAQKEKEDLRDRRIMAGEDLLSIFGLK